LDPNPFLRPSTTEPVTTDYWSNLGELLPTETLAGAILLARMQQVMGTTVICY
jgi:hypothetical protein